MRSAHHYHDRYRRGGSVCVSNAEVAIDTAGVASYSYLFFWLVCSFHMLKSIIHILLPTWTLNPPFNSNT